MTIIFQQSDNLVIWSNLAIKRHYDVKDWEISYQAMVES